MNPQKEFKIVSIIMLFLGVIDALTIGAEWFNADSSLFTGNALLLAIFAVICVIALAKMYLGVMGLKYCNGTGKGTLHIKLAKIGLFFSVIAVAISIFDMISGTGTLATLVSNSADAVVIHWYLGLAKKNYA